MKKGILSLLILLMAMQIAAQTRLSLYEEFTGEQCFPCTATNPGLQALIAANAAKVLLITYHSPLPVAGPVYNANKTVSDARISYYGITTAPQGRLNGTKLGSGSAFPTAPGHAGNLIQADINTEAASSSPFNISVSHSWNGTGDSITVQVTVTAPAAYAPAGANLKLRVALVEHLHYRAAPGINGEQDFPNVVREMYPAAGGTAISASWTASQSMPYTIKGLVPKFVNKEAANIVVWIQNDADKSIQQAAISAIVPIPLDAHAAAIKPPARLQCVAGSASVSSVATLRNAGTATITSAKIYYRTDGGPLALYNWSGSLIPGASTVVPLPPVSIGGGNHYMIDSVVLPNGAADINMGNNVAVGDVAVYNTMANSLPIASGFEGSGGAVPAGWVLYDADSNGINFAVTKNIFGGNVGYSNSTYFLLHNNYYVPAGETAYAILPAANLPNGDKTLVFAQAHAPYNTENDQLDVVYSTDCGGHWTSVWNASGTSLSTAPATMDFFVPTQAQWTIRTVDISVVPAGAMIAFRAISDYGNSLYIDNVQLSIPTAVPGSGLLQSVSVYPNPAAATAAIDLRLSQSANISILVSDATGRGVAALQQEHKAPGVQHIALPIANLAGGIYYIQIVAEGDVVTKRLVVLR